MCFGLFPSVCVQFGRKEPLEMTVRNHRATLLPSVLKIFLPVTVNLSHEGNHLLWRFFLQSETLGLFHTVSPARSSGAHADLLGVWLASVSYHLSKWSSPMPAQFHLGHN